MVALSSELNAAEYRVNYRDSESGESFWISGIKKMVKTVTGLVLAVCSSKPLPSKNIWPFEICRR